MNDTDPNTGHEKPKCGADTSTPEHPDKTCGLSAGHGTEHPGIGRCKHHGGSTPNHIKAAQKEQARRDVAQWGGRRDIRPAEALLELVQFTAGEVDYWRTRVAAIAEEDEADLTWGVTKVKEGGDDYGTTSEAKPNIAYAMLVDASNRLERYASSALKAGADAAMVQIARSQGVMLSAVIKRILTRLDLSEAQLQLVGVVVPEELRAVGPAEQAAS